ncbi:MAG: thioredoxin domain-containing protein [Planctomycetes bacterium]|nr:thioredoxin domain-containing protein [Planctomycetota bacterium]
MNDPAEPKHTNRLAQEKSPYLLQHAHNPVDWYPWGEEAFAKAKRENKPVLVSIGYATCHWCHVMERESFENEEVAAFLNAHFVAVKVDREERPDVDELYMSVVQALTGSGGWPLNVFLTPEKKPFFGGTYFPYPHRLPRRGNFLDLLKALSQAWAEDQDAVVKDAERITQHITSLGSGAPAELEAARLDAGFEQLQSRFDQEHAGFGTTTKFPTPHNVGFLLRYYQRTDTTAALDMATRTLDAMLSGGLRDHLGGGFHRYTVDPAWEIPHFEKMLYDQAGLTRAFVEGYQVTGHARYAEVARETLEFVLRDMRDAKGGFTSAWDADSEGLEGKCYVWTQGELREILGDEFLLFAARYAVSEEGNFHEFPGKNHLQLNQDLETIAATAKLSVDEVEARLAACRARLLGVREQRIPPLHDDKVLSDWNGHMIGALALAGRVLDEPRYVTAAQEAAEFVLTTLRPEGELMHRYREGEVGIPALLDDYAFMAWGLVELYQATFEPRYLREAKALLATLQERFGDAEGGGFFASPADTELLHRSKPSYDGAMPSGNAAAATALLELGLLLQDPALGALGAKALASLSETLTKAPGFGATQALQALDLHLGPDREVVVAGALEAEETQALLRVLRATFLPRTVVLHRPPGEAPEIAALVPFVAAQTPVDGKPAAYVCRDYTCQQPVTSAAELSEQLRK